MRCLALAGVALWVYAGSLLPSSASPLTCVPANCDDGSVCTDDSCSAGQCLHTFNTNSCNDGDACTTGDVCHGGECFGSHVDCDDRDSCTHDLCDSATGACANPVKANGLSCDDGNPCTVIDECANGVCVGSGAKPCTAPDPCHTAGTCDPDTGICSTPAKANGTACDDRNLCTQVDTCQDGICVGGSEVVCTSSGPCHFAGACDPGTGSCSNPVETNGVGCSDGNGCTTGDVCQCGVCVGAAIVLGEVGHVRLGPPKVKISWDPGCAPGQSYDVVRGLVPALPVGSGSEFCVAPSTSAETTNDFTTPSPGASFFYVVRCKNACGAGSYGAASDGTPRTTNACP